MMKNTEKKRIVAALANCENVHDATSYFEGIIQLKAKFNQNKSNVRLTQFLIILGNHDRFLLLDAIKQQDRCVCELEAIIDKSQPAISHHLKLLEQMQLIRGWKKGKFTHYSIVEKTIKEFDTLWKEWSTEITNWFGT